MKKQPTLSPLSVMKQNAAEAEALLKLLANARRLMILCHLLKQRHSVGELLEKLDLSQSALSQHLAKMREQGLISSEKEGQKVYYQVENPKVKIVLTALYEIYCKNV